LIKKLERTVWDLIREKGGTIEECRHVVHMENPGNVCNNPLYYNEKKPYLCPGVENCDYQTLIRGAQYIDEGK